MTLALDHQRLGHDSAEPMLRVVLADDSAATRTLARYALSEGAGFAPLDEAVDGAAALLLVEQVQPDCVVLDLEMPGMGGLEALGHLRRRWPSIPVVVLSGSSDPARAQQATAGGATSYVDKSVGLDHLAETIKTVVRRELAAPSPQDVAQPLTPAVRQPPGAPGRDELEQLEYVVSHDLGEPLRIIAGFAKLMQDRYADSVDASGQSFLECIVDAAGRMQLMLDDLLTYSRAGHATAAPDLVDLGRLVGAAVDALPDPPHSLDVKVSVATLPPVVADATMLTTVIRELMINAMTFNVADSPTVAVAGREVGGRAVVTITDNGVGIHPADQERVFTLFQRLNARTEYAGTGTGLALCRRLLGLQDGTIELESAPGAGTTVTLTLPIPDHLTPSDPPRGDRP